ncbi:ASCH domain-containing protein [Sporomusa sp. KB1]|jgi:hypothetical protein|uniref:ASCH domain-containing protein n=1 Tax=Sporomusa sp. KB1 TaxID=943346 RepID=UPI0011A21CCF|nr:ASCH domain-containing protein [Sporomusa sp. KB1]TWH45918.1 ASCH domain-containing protein [Sporomusa sp. KB1]
MKALTILQPWASLIAYGAKRIETRNWVTKYRGPIAIHAGKGWTMDRREITYREPFHSALWPNMTKQELMLNGYGRTKLLPVGAVIAIADLVEVYVVNGYGHDLNWQPGVNDEQSKFYYAYPDGIKEPKAEDFIRIRYPETMFGYYPNGGFKKEPRYAWILANVRRIEPVPSKGMQRLWEWNYDYEEAI